MPLVKFHADDELADKIMGFTGHRVASKSFAYAAEKCLQLDTENQQLRALVAELQVQVQVYQQTLASARDVAIQLAELAVQGDMFQPKETAPSRLRHHLREH